MFKIPPTDSRFMDLTEEQLDLMYEHLVIDTGVDVQPKQPDKEVKDDKARDDSYKDDEPEHYADPDFEEEWAIMEDIHKEELEHLEGGLPVMTGITSSTGGIPNEGLLPTSQHVDINSEEWEEV
jgi:hypothetical protein